MLALFSCACCGGMMWWGYSALRQSEVYQLSLAEVQKDPQVLAALGAPIEPGFSINVQTSWRNGVATAQADYAIKGARGGAMVHASALRHATAPVPPSGNVTRWVLTRVTVNPDAGGPPIEVVDPTMKPPIP